MFNSTMRGLKATAGGGPGTTSGKREQRKPADVLGDMRKQWIAAEEQPIERRPAKRGRRLQAAAETVASEWRLMLNSLRSAGRELYARLRARRDREMGERRGVGLTPFVLVFLVVVVAGGAVAYVAAVKFLSAAQDSPVAAAPPQETQAAAAADPEPKQQVEDTAGANENRSSAIALPSMPVAAEGRPAPLFAAVGKHTPDVAKSAPVNASAKVLSSSVEGVDDLARQIQRRHIEQQSQSAGRASVAPQPGSGPGAYELRRSAPAAARAEPQYSAAAPFYVVATSVADMAVNSPAAAVSETSTDVAFYRSTPMALTGTKTGLSAGEADRAKIANGGAVEYRVRHVHRLTGTSHAATIRVTSTTVEFIPDGRCELGRITVPAASVRAVNGSPGLLNLTLLRSDAGQTQLTVANATGRGAQASLGRLSYVLAPVPMIAGVRK